MGTGRSSEITKAVAEVFAPHFLKQPVVVWISESGKKVAPFDQEFTQALNLNIDARKVLPDMILMDVGTPFRLVFVEVVATNGPVTADRKAALTQIARHANYKEDDLVFVTAYHDRGSAPFKSTVSRLAWGTFAWFSNEPHQLLVMDSGEGNLRLSLDGGKLPDEVQ